MWFIVGVVILVLAIVAVRSASKRQEKAYAEQRWNERVAQLAGAIATALRKPGTSEQEGTALSYEYLKQVVRRGAVHLTPLDDSTHAQAQEYVDKTLKSLVQIFSDACAKQVAHREKVQLLRREKAGQLSVADIAALSEEKDAIEKGIRMAKNDFWFTHADAKELKFRVWDSHQDYLLLKEESNHA